MHGPRRTPAASALGRNEAGQREPEALVGCPAGVACARLRRRSAPGSLSAARGCRTNTPQVLRVICIIACTTSAGRITTLIYALPRGVRGAMIPRVHPHPTGEQRPRSVTAFNWPSWFTAVPGSWRCSPSCPRPRRPVAAHSRRLGHSGGRQSMSTAANEAPRPEDVVSRRPPKGASGRWSPLRGRHMGRPHRGRCRGYSNSNVFCPLSNFSCS